MIKVIEKLKKEVEKNPNNIAYIINGEKITYKELWDKALYYSNYLKREGISPVIIYGNKEISVLISMLSCIFAKRAYINIDYNIPLERLGNIINITKSSLILSDSQINIDNVSCLSLNELTKFEKNEIKDNNNDIVYIIFTSGTTGIPKSIYINETNLNNFVDWVSNLEELSSYKNIIVLNTASFSFDLSVADIFYSLCNGHTLIALNSGIDDNYERVFNIIKDINMIVLTPTFIKYLILNKDFNNSNYPMLKCIYSCGEQLEVKVARKLLELFPDLNLINAYGPTEATSAISAIRIENDMLCNDLLPVGNINNLASNVFIIDNEIVIKGKSVFNGMLSNNVKGFFLEGNINCYKTGDIGFIKNDLLYVKGRIDNQIKYKGYRIEIEEIELTINNIKGVKDVVVIPKYNNYIIKTIKAYIIPDNDISIDYIKRELKNKLPLYMVPKSIIFVDSFPINKNGKIDRKALSNYD